MSMYDGPPLTRKQVVAYEAAASSWWADHFSWGWAQRVASKYIDWKVGRKFRRYEAVRSRADRIADRRRAVNRKPDHDQEVSGVWNSPASKDCSSTPT